MQGSIHFFNLCCMMIWKNRTIQIRTRILLEHVSFQLRKGQSLGIMGSNGVGKTVLARAIAGELEAKGGSSETEVFLKRCYVPFHSSLALRNGGAVYRQQRWNKIDTELLPTVSEVLAQSSDFDHALKLAGQFGLEPLLDSFVINLSNGEQRKLELVRALASRPDLLVLDNAYTGLDSAARPFLTQMLEQLMADGLSIVMTGLQPDDFPASVHSFIQIDEKGMQQVFDRSEIQLSNVLQTDDAPFDVPLRPKSGYSELVWLENVSLCYGDRIILDRINWTINIGERWSLMGPNGSGKTSLLNLIFADNPQAYKSRIRLFGRDKGSGESIWDIKAKIGFISPELHQYLPQKQTAVDVICSGFNEAEGTFSKPTSFQRDVAKRWLRTVGYSHVAEQLFGELATSAQRIVLILRTLVKNPPLMILDEPYQGLDRAHVLKLNRLFDRIAATTDCAMIFVTHLPDEIPSCVTKHFKLNAGRVV
jgi:molybdate transport system ATP-binding protein